MLIRPLYRDPVSGRLVEMAPGDSIEGIGSSQTEASLVQTVCLFQPMEAGTCFQFIDEYANIINAVGPQSVLRDKPWVDGVVLEGGIQGQFVKAAIIKGNKYFTGEGLTLPFGKDLYLGLNGKLVAEPPTKLQGANWQVIVCRYIDPHNFVFDPQVPVDLNASQNPGGSGDSNLPNPSGRTNEALFSDGSGYLLKKIRQSDIAPDFAISLFTPGISVVEIGQTLTSPLFLASYTEAPKNVKLYDEVHTTEVDITLPATSFNSSYTFQRTIQDIVTFTIKATSVEDKVLTRSANIAWFPQVFWGAGVLPAMAGQYPDFVSALSNSALTNTKSRTFTVTAASNQKIYYAYPDNFGEATFEVGGFVGGFKLVASNVDITNEYGITIRYRLYESDNPGLGTINIRVD